MGMDCKIIKMLIVKLLKCWTARGENTCVTNPTFSWYFWTIGENPIAKKIRFEQQFDKKKEDRDWGKKSL